MDEADALSLAELLDERRHLLDVAFWMLGSARDAEQVVDDAYRRWYALSADARREIARPRSWLARTAGRACLTRLSGTDQGACEPEPQPAQDTQGSSAGLLAEVSRVLLDALDALPPDERAAFVLHDVFGMAPGKVAAIVERSEPECAELAERARASIRRQRARPTSPREQDAVVRSVERACASGDEESLAALLCADATAFFDGGGKVRTLDRPVHGSRQVARALLTLLARRPRTALRAQSVNGRTGLVVRHERRVAAVIGLDVADHRVAQVWVVLNPDKLRSWNEPHGPRA